MSMHRDTMDSSSALKLFFHQPSTDTNSEIKFFSKWKKKSIIQDGNSLFRAIASELYGTEDKHTFIREKIVNHVVQNWELYSSTINENSYYGVHIDDAIDYFNIMSKVGTCGGALELNVAVLLFNVLLNVYNFNESTKMGKKNFFNHKRHLRYQGEVKEINLLHEENGHYDFLIKKPRFFKHKPLILTSARNKIKKAKLKKKTDSDDDDYDYEDDEVNAIKLARTSTERSREYRMRQKAAKSDSLDDQEKGKAKTSAERTREFRLRQKAMKDGLPVPRRVKSGVVRAREYRVRKAAERKAYELGELGDEADVEDWLTILNNKRAHQANRMREYRARKKAERLGLVYTKPLQIKKKEIKQESSSRYTNTKYNPSEHSNSESRWENSEDSIGSYGDPHDYSDDESSAIDPEILIGLVKEHDILYNTKNSSYRDNSKKEAIWQLISQKLEQPKTPFSEITSEDCRMQWNSLRDRYRKHLRKRKLGLLSVPNKKWKYEDKISFIAPFFKDSALAESNTEDDSHLETAWENVQVKLEPSESEMEFEDETLQIIPNVEVKIEATSPLHATENDFTDDKIQPQDEIELFFYSLAQTVKKFPPYYRSIAKADICAAVSKIELSILSNPDPTQET